MRVLIKASQIIPKVIITAPKATEIGGRGVKAIYENSENESKVVNNIGGVELSTTTVPATVVKKENSQYGPN